MPAWLSIILNLLPALIESIFHSKPKLDASPEDHAAHAVKVAKLHELLDHIKANV